MAVINKGTDHEAEGCQPDRRREITDYDIERGEVHRRGEDPEGDGLGQGPTDRQSSQFDLAVGGRAKVIPAGFVGEIQ